VKDGFAQPLVFEQIKAIALTLVLAVVGTTVIAFAVKAVMGLRPVEDVELAGLDISEHGEEGYHGEDYGGRSAADAGHIMSEPILNPAKAPKPAMS
jgi:ammonia channel protein AmtB